MWRILRPLPCMSTHIQWHCSTSCKYQQSPKPTADKCADVTGSRDPHHFTNTPLNPKLICTWYRIRCQTHVGHVPAFPSSTLLDRSSAADAGGDGSGTEQHHDHVRLCSSCSLGATGSLNSLRGSTLLGQDTTIIQRFDHQRLLAQWDDQQQSITDMETQCAIKPGRSWTKWNEFSCCWKCLALSVFPPLLVLGYQRNDQAV